MGSVTKKQVYFGIFLVYFVAAFAFFAIGFQPVKDASAVYAAEAETADSELNIPSIDLIAPVKETNLSGADLIVPEQIAGSFSNAKNKTLIIGHSSTIFENLHKIALGDTFSYDDAEYQVADIAEQEKSTIDMSKILESASRETLVLMTCSGDPIPNTNGDHTHRLIVTAEKI